MYYAFCGIDGAGKTTVLEKVYEKLKEKGYAVCKSKIKLNSIAVFSEYSKKVYKDKFEFYNELPPELVRVAVAIDFASHYMEKGEEFKKYDIVLCDRYALCYRAYGLAYGVKDMTVANEIFGLIEEPRMYFYFDVGIDEAIRRLKERGDYIEEEENPQLLGKVKEGYEELLKEKENVVYIDAEKEVDEIAEEIVKEICGGIKK